MHKLIEMRHTDLTLTDRAVTVAHHFLADLRDKGNVRIFEHCKMVATIVMGFSRDPAAYCVGMLHDVLEDTLYTPEEMRQDFGDKITDAVLILTHTRYGQPHTRAYREYILDIAASHNILAIECKIADLIHNTDPRRATTPEQVELRRRTGDKYLDALHLLLGARAALVV